MTGDGDGDVRTNRQQGYFRRRTDATCKAFECVLEGHELFFGDFVCNGLVVMQAFLTRCEWRESGPYGLLDQSIPGRVPGEETPWSRFCEQLESCERTTLRGGSHGHK